MTSRHRYYLTLTEADIQTIAFVGDRYAWSDSILALEVGVNELTEAEAWTIRDAIEADMEGGHSPFPMLDHRSHLCEKLTAFWSSIV